ncbi:YlzJ-like family protein [Sulfobacillus harzensis]|uniref:YlzJ-like protein n=1 Tax=Sulfobacillus harzensis TaxID=2729629 RepID=A0A7Y0L3R3_9FIRM|nr:YlzJ-like family protein [Sulfobacillus harzensis]NMP21855.1 hypothetical protein [Sulfobacillus harzensis]
MLYTPLSYEEIFPAKDEVLEVFETEVRGRRVLCRRGADGLPRVERLLSTDPADYLDPDWMPGSVLQF